ncbi:MAG TPA: acetate--CoA ligase family protein, partial [Gaiellaceae bacterium]|nr:acetate--CoA ligase family protein [Gaiellaceae bacterium]
VRATSLEELIDASALLSRKARVSGRSVALLTNAGGLGILCADACEAAGLELHSLGEQTVQALRALLAAEASLANPVDMLGGATEETYAAVIPHLLADPVVDALIVLFVPAVSSTADQVARAVERTVREVDVDKPTLAVIVSSEGIPPVLRDSEHVAAFAYPESAAKALGHAADRAEWLRRPQGIVPLLEGIDHGAARAVVERVLSDADDAWLDPESTRALLLAYGIPLVPERVAGSAEEAGAVAVELGLPVVVKTATPGAHKTETGGIALDLGDEESVREAVERIGAPVVVQPMLKAGAELLAGVVQDPMFGPLVAFGPGGVFAELIGQAAFRIAPLTGVDAEELVTSGKAGLLVAGFRGTPPADAAALKDLLHRLSRLGEELPEVAELDLNPVFALPDRCVAVDARVRVRRVEAVGRTKTW